MRSARVFSLLACIGSSALLACGGRTVQFVGSGNRVRERSTTAVVASESKLYSFDAPVDLSGVGTFPVLGPAYEDWTVVTWTRELGGRERAAILEFLESEGTKYGTSDQERQVRERLDEIRGALSRQSLDSALVSYRFKLDRPGSSGYRYGDWLSVYYLDARSRTIFEITNAFR